MLIELVYILGEYDEKYYEGRGLTASDIEFDSIYEGDNQDFAILQDGEIIERGDTGHLNLEDYLEGMFTGLNMAQIEYDVDEYSISIKNWCKKRGL